jgi:hypothetical protein
MHLVDKELHMALSVAGSFSKIIATAAKTFLLCASNSA